MASNSNGGAGRSRRGRKGRGGDGDSSAPKSADAMVEDAIPTTQLALAAPAPIRNGVLVLNGPNINLLGTREPHIYGHETLADIIAKLKRATDEAGLPFDALQSNAEYALIDRIHAARTDGTAFIIINPAAFTHTSVALRDALAGVALPFIEVHLSNVQKREAFRHHSYFSDIAVGTIVGMGSRGYFMALAYALEEIEKSQN